MTAPTHRITAVIKAGFDLSPVWQVECRNDPDDPARDCRHGYVPARGECDVLAYQAPETVARYRITGEPMPCRGGWVGTEHVHWHTSSSNEPPCGLVAWLEYTGMVAVDRDVVIPAEGTVRWEEDPWFVPAEVGA